jgi:DNA sulfur modification protein DndE
MFKWIFPLACSLLAMTAFSATASRDDGAPARIHLMGDSTVASYKEAQFPLMGWGQVFGRLFGSDVEVVNYAVGGRSTKSFIDEKRWDAVLAALAPGDWLFIQFGHNDEKKDKPEVYAAPDGAYPEFLTLFVTKAREKGANPVLVTPVARRIFKTDGTFYQSHGVYPDAMKAVAAQTKTPVIDLTEKSGALLVSLGAEASKKLYNYCEPGQYPGWPNGNKDDSHFCEDGAVKMAKLVASGIRELGLPLAGRLKK